MTLSISSIREEGANGTDHRPTQLANAVLPDGSFVVTAEQLTRLGRGDQKAGRRELRLILAAERERTVYVGPTDKPSQVRVAGPSDEEALLRLLLIDLKENAEKIAPIDESRVMAHIQAGTRRRGGIVGVIDAPNEGAPIAMCLLIPAQWWWSRAYHVADIVNFVHPDHRNSHHIDALLAFERWAVDQWSRSFGYRIYLLTSVLGRFRVREKIELFRRKFYQAGACFLYPAPPTDDTP